MRWSAYSGAVIALFLLTSLHIALNSPRYAVLQRFPIGGEGGWDCLEIDSASQRLFISRGTHVMVLDVTTGKLVGDIPNTNGVHDIAIVPKANKAYISDGRDNAVMVVDLTSLKELSQIRAGNRPDVMAYDEKTNRVFAFNGGSSDVTVIDPKTDQVITTVALAGKPEFARADGKGSMFINIEDKSEIQKLNTRGLQTAGTWPLAPGESPSGLGMDRKHHLLFSACDNGNMMVSDYQQGKTVGTAAIGNGPDGAGFDSKLGLAFSPNGQDGTLTVIDTHGGKFSPIQTLETQKSARTMALDPKTHRIYLIAAQFEGPQPGETNQRRKMVPGTATILVVGPANS